MDTHYPWWVTAIVALGTPLGALIGVLAGVYLKLRQGRVDSDLAYKKGEVEVKAAQAKVTVERAKAETDLEIHVTNDAIAKWRSIAEEAFKQLETLTIRHQETLNSFVKQQTDREIQIDQIIDGIRKEAQQRYDALDMQHKQCLTDNAELRAVTAEMRGRIGQLEKMVSEMQARIEARAARRGQ